MSKSDVLERVRCVAMTDSVHTVDDNTPEDIQDFLKERARNWVVSDKPLDTDLGWKDGCECVSAGHGDHEHTTASAMESVFAFLKEQM